MCISGLVDEITLDQKLSSAKRQRKLRLTRWHMENQLQPHHLNSLGAAETINNTTVTYYYHLSVYVKPQLNSHYYASLVLKHISFGLFTPPLHNIPVI